MEILFLDKVLIVTPLPNSRRKKSAPFVGSFWPQMVVALVTEQGVLLVILRRTN